MTSLPLTVGTPSRFAIESQITTAYQRPSERALGYLVLHIGGRRYGVLDPHATLLACSFDEVVDRVKRRGSHRASFAYGPDASLIADSVNMSIYGPDVTDRAFLGVPHAQFLELIQRRHVVWAPDGDEAFDDGSRVLQFDIDRRVRLIAFNTGADCRHDPATLRDVSLDGDEFYGILQDWSRAFELAWLSAPKSPEQC